MTLFNIFNITSLSGVGKMVSTLVRTYLGDKFLLETGDDILLENGGFIVIEQQDTTLETGDILQSNGDLLLQS
tara:strand:+ start:33 stop:251 length:219 start_codon:yes stop_codon:yes gene_type:complete